jgi:hypothetical protein
MIEEASLYLIVPLSNYLLPEDVIVDDDTLPISFLSDSIFESL